jgi:hypothetical protein
LTIPAMDINPDIEANYVRAERRLRPTNFAALRRVALSLLKQNPSKQSIPLKRKAAALDPDFLAEILTGANNPAKG